MTTTRKPRRLTNKEKVLRKWPGAYCERFKVTPPEWHWFIYLGTSDNSHGHGRTPALAWADAARRMK